MEYQLRTTRYGLPVILAPAPDTPRMALAVAIRGGTRRETVPGISKLAGNLLLKGTETRSAEELVRQLDERGVDLREITLSDCMVVMVVCVNRELPFAMEVLQDVLFHSTFADFDKEAAKLVGEIQASLDLPADQAHDLLLGNLFPDDPYGYTGTRILEEYARANADSVRQWFIDGLDPRRMTVGLAGNFVPEETWPALDALFADLQGREFAWTPPAAKLIADSRVVTQAHPSAEQAQIMQAWYAAPNGDARQAPTIMMNAILGGGGLSSRLFTELRDKQGLAYSVRSQYISMLQAGELVISIGTSPENIMQARQGFIDQLHRLQNEAVPLEELQQAKGRLRGTYVLSHETNSQWCLDLAINTLYGFGPDFSLQMLQRIEGVTAADVQHAAQQITPPSVTAIVAREEALAGVE